MRSLVLILFGLLVTLSGCETPSSQDWRTSTMDPYIVVLGTAQDGGVPQAGSHSDPRWSQNAEAHRVVSLGLVDPSSDARWMFEATPDFPSQWQDLDRIASNQTDGAGSDVDWKALPRSEPDGIFLTHAHIGHYTGLMYLGHESLGASSVPVYAMPRMADFLSRNGPWSQLVRYGNVDLRVMAADSTMRFGRFLHITPFTVPHRQEYSEVVGYRIEGANRAAVFIPDIDSWKEWDQTGTELEDVLESVDFAFLDATFFANGEIPGRDMSTFPHPFAQTTMNRLAALPRQVRQRVYFIHMNHTNPLLDPESGPSRSVREAGFNVAREGMKFGL